MLQGRDRVPRSVRTSATVAVLVLTYGTVVHLVQLAVSGFDPYPRLPGWLRTYFVALTVLDPVAAVQPARRRRSGLVLAVAVLVSDAAANARANDVIDHAPGVTPGRVGQAVTTALAVGLLAAAPGLWRCCPPRSRP